MTAASKKQLRCDRIYGRIFGKGVSFMEKCFVAVSGGVDSAAALMIMKNRGYDVTGITMRVVPACDETESAKALCDALGVPHITLSLEEEFGSTVIADFISCYQNGLTPNPCVVCNKKIKFGILAKAAYDLGAHCFATGHYVRTEVRDGRRVIKKSLCIEKDQSYMLWSLSEPQLARFEAPLGGMTKDEARSIVGDTLPDIASKKDSQDICFIPDGDYRAFLDGRIGHPDRTGDFVLKDGRTLGTHSGLRNYTIGQRKGLGIAYSEPLYVISKNACDNSILLGSDSDLYTDRIYVSGCSFSGMDYPRESFRCTLTARYRGREVGATVTPLVGGRAVIELDVPLRAVTAGQSAVFYDGDVLLGGGVIE